MAISVNGARFIAHVVRRGISLGSLVTVGRQSLYAPKSAVNRMLATTGRAERYRLAPGDPGYPLAGEWADELYPLFGATSVRVLDGSAYEGADLVQNLNQPLPTALHESFDCLLDGGTLEHVFNVPEALASYMKLVKVGGHVMLLDMPATNGCGHGFYQFSPALFWQVFAAQHGFEVVDMLVVEAAPFAPFWRVGNPAVLKRRVELVHPACCYLYVVARKLRAFAGFAPMPVQDDYATSWQADGTAAPGAGVQTSLGTRVRRLAARLAPMAYWRMTNRRNNARTAGEATLGGTAATNPYTRVREQ